MVIQIEWFLADNALMNLLLIRIAAALLGKRLRWYAAGAFAALGAVYALLSVAAIPVLADTLPKILFGALAALLLSKGRRGYWKALLALYLSAFLMGGLVLGVTILFGGRISGGALIGTVPVRIMLLAAVICVLLPRTVRSLITAYRHRTQYTKIRLFFSDRVIELRTLIDSGNLLTEPLSGLPVVIVRSGLLPRETGRLVSYSSVGGAGILTAIRPEKLLVYGNGWMEVDAYVAESPERIEAADAIMSAELYYMERKLLRDQKTDESSETVVCETSEAGEAGDMVHSFRRDTSDAVCAGRGSSVDTTAYAG